MPRFIDARDLRRRWDDRQWGPKRTYADLRERLEDGRAGKPGGVHFRDFSIRNLFEELLPDGKGPEIVRLMEGSRRGRHVTPLLEATNAVDTSAFSSIVGQLMFSAILEGYESPQYVWPQLVSSKQTTMLWGEKVPGIAKLGDVSLPIGEGQPYPLVGTSEEYIETGPLQKRGFIVPVTREITIADHTGLLLGRCGKTAEAMAMKSEKDAISLVIGATGFNNYKRNGTATNTYLTSGAYVNSKTSNALVDWTNIEKLELLFAAMNDPNTGEPINIAPQSMKLLVPKALYRTALHVARATQVEKVDNQANAVTYRTYSENPLRTEPGLTLNVLSSPYVDRLGNSTDWFLGDFPGAFAKMTAWEIEQDQLGQGSHLAFNNDIIHQFKGSKMDRFQAWEPRKAAKSAA
jgi:hypothetical protein